MILNKLITSLFFLWYNNEKSYAGGGIQLPDKATIEFTCDTATGLVHAVVTGNEAEQYYLMRDIYLPYKVDKDSDGNIIRFKGHLNKDASEYVVARHKLDQNNK